MNCKTLLCPRPSGRDLGTEDLNAWKMSVLGRVSEAPDHPWLHLGVCSTKSMPRALQPSLADWRAERPEVASCTKTVSHMYREKPGPVFREGRGG